MRRVLALLLVASSALAQDIVIVNQSHAVGNSSVSVVSPVETKGFGIVEEI